MRFILIALCFLLALTMPCHAQGDKAKPNTLTPKEIADGWILLFDGETTFGWNVLGDAEVKEGVLKVGGAKPAQVATTTQFDVGVTELQVRWSGNEEPKLKVGGKGIVNRTSKLVKGDRWK